MSSFENATPGGPELAQLIGPIVIGNLILFTLFGILTVQVCLYHLAFPKDKIFTKIAVYGTYTLMVVQVSFLSNRKAGAIVIAMIALLSSVSSWIAAAFGFQVGPEVINLNALHGNAKNMRIFDGIAYISSAVCDVIIAVSMFYLLTRNGNIIHRRTRFVVGRLLRLTVETNIITALSGIAASITLYAFPDTNYFAATTILLPEIYSNSFLLMLNSRMSLTHEQRAEADPSMANLSLPPIEDLCPSEPNIRSSAIVIDFPDVDETKSEESWSSKGH
ncbi:hypothetical protein VNI00_004331 [Paramarasmius palmivorus]|uniref:DUF6534 domain-containing protein n=1 Tax=Paramarasmius palmivorus TaxID=297713 RepID=A0AAW0DMF8_9AGAR